MHNINFCLKGVGGGGRLAFFIHVVESLQSGKLLPSCCSAAGSLAALLRVLLTS